MLYLSTIFFVMISSSAFGFEITKSGSFHSSAQLIHFQFNPNQVAIPVSADPGTKITDGKFRELGVAIVSADLAKNALGLPVYFPDSDGYGVLTDEVLVRTTDAISLYNALDDLNGVVHITRQLMAQGIYTIKFISPESAALGAEKLYGKKNIIYSHPNFLLPLESRSSPELEPLFPAQWNLQNTGLSGGTSGSDINVKPAWRIATGSSETIIAVIDLGFEQDHPDLREAWFINDKEIPGNRADDDGNGLKDDVSGWNYAVNGTNLVYGQNPAHGTSTSGIIGARANGQGITGICPGCKVLPIVIDAEVENAVAAFLYAKSLGVKVISNSWGYKIGTPKMDALVDAINQTATGGQGAKGISIVFAMSNFAKNDCRGPEPDISSLDSVIAVSSVDHHDLKVEASAFGPCMEFVAPTSGSTTDAVATTDRLGIKGYNRGENPDDFPDLDYTQTFYGTSAATPQVAGTLGLLYSVNPNLSAAAAFALLKNSADKVHPDLAGYNSEGHSSVYGFGRINAGRAAELAAAQLQ